MHDLLALDRSALATTAAAVFGEHKGAGIANAVHADAVREGRFQPEAHGIGAVAAASWRAAFCLQLPTIAERQREPCAHGELQKLLLTLHDGQAIETVLLPMGRGRHSQCLSTQVGCARACTFCETGRSGLLRNLTAGEITAQVTLARTLGIAPRTLVFMGMGEPLDNLDGLLPALSVLTDRSGLAFAHDKITICTVGHVPGIERLRQLGHRRLGLNLSLNAADDRLRAELMPHSARFPLREIHAALVAYRQRANLQFGIHYCLLPGINDVRADATAIAHFCRGLGRVLVHVIPYNPGTAAITRAPEMTEIERFVGWLRDEGLPVRRRITKGRSVMAACGQLGRPTSTPPATG